MSGLTINLPEPTLATPGAVETTLPTGAVASIRKGTGRDLRLAQMSVGQPFDPLRFEYALIAQVAVVGGKKLTMEAIDTMPIDDVLTLQAEVNRVNFPTRRPAAAAEAAS